MRMARWPLACAWPTNSASVCGRIARSVGSNAAASPETSRVIRLRSLRSYGGQVRPSRKCEGGASPELLQRGLDDGRNLGVLAEADQRGVDGATGGHLGDLQAEQRGDGLAGRAGLVRRRDLGMEGGHGAVGDRLFPELRRD